MTKRLILLILFLGYNIYVVENFKVPRAELKNRPSSLISVDTGLGTLVGYKQKVNYENLVDNKEINVFYEVPYAEPPIGDLRFRKAKVINKFPKNPYQATEYKSHCWVNDFVMYNENDTFSEDCLYMNIWTPNLETLKQNGICSRKVPIIFYVQGGGNSNLRMYPLLDKNNASYLVHSGELFSALYDTIVVVNNYRQKMFASLYVDGEYSGNNAISDQDAALKFISRNIEDLCGDKNKVTIISSSVGGKYAAYLLTNKESNKLINGAIFMAPPYVFSPHTPVTANEAMLNSLVVINYIGCLNLRTNNLSRNVRSLDRKIRLKYFRQIGGQYRLKEKLFLTELDKASLKIEQHFEKLRKEIMYLDIDNYLDKNFVRLVKFLSKYIVDLKCLKTFDPRLINANTKNTDRAFEFIYDMDTIDEQTFLNYRLYNKLEINPNINLLTGLTEDEMLKDVFHIKDNYYHDPFTAPVVSKEEAKNLIIENNGLKVETNGDHENFEFATADYYTDERWELKRGYFDSYVNMINDQQIFCPNYFYSYYSAMAINVSNYVLTHKVTKHFSTYLMDYDFKDISWVASTHADDVIYVFGLPFKTPNHFTDLDRKFSLQLMQIWTSFVRDGSLPALSNGKEWPVANRHSSPKPRYVEISGSCLREREFEFIERCEELYRPLLPYYKR